MPADLAEIQALIAPLKQRGMCFNLMCDFVDRATTELKLDQANDAWHSMMLIHRGNARR